MKISLCCRHTLTVSVMEFTSLHLLVWTQFHSINNEVGHCSLTGPTCRFLLVWLYYVNIRRWWFFLAEEQDYYFWVATNEVDFQLIDSWRVCYRKRWMTSFLTRVMMTPQILHCKDFRCICLNMSTENLMPKFLAYLIHHPLYSDYIVCFMAHVVRGGKIIDCI